MGTIFLSALSKNTVKEGDVVTTPWCIHNLDSASSRESPRARHCTNGTLSNHRRPYRRSISQHCHAIKHAQSFDASESPLMPLRPYPASEHSRLHSATKLGLSSLMSPRRGGIGKI
ncbi:hypothetical protein BC835DRAFT_721353 [Cytidiella melzeri]|nr:hypothetical protein BC835DRAFT_721353 [Cytidiella melzeri]